MLTRISEESGLTVPPLSAHALAELTTQPLLGNVRELENLLHRAVALCDGDELVLDTPQFAASMPAPLTAEATGVSSDTCSAPLYAVTEMVNPASIPGDLQSHMDQQEREILVKTLKETGFNRTVAAQRLGLSLRQIRYRIARLKIDVPASRDDGTDE